jgi:PKD repeat protein
VAVSGTVSNAESGENAEVYWNFNTATPSSNQTVTFTVGAISQGNNNGNTTMLTSNSVSSGYTGASGTNNAGVAARIGSLNLSANGSACFEFTVSPASGVTANVTAISFGARSTSTGPQAYEIRSSADQFASAEGSGTFLNDTKWAFKEHPSIGISSNAATTFRIYGFAGSGNASASQANWRIDDLKLTISTTAVPVSTAPVIDSASVASATAFSAFEYQITATNAPTSFSATDLPNGLSCDPATGLISGTPTAPGTYLATIVAANAQGRASATLSIVVSSNPLAPAITGNLSDTGQLRAPFDFQIEATNSPKAYLASGLPPGLALNSATGLISGTPETAGNFTVWLTVQNDYGSDSKTLHFAITDPTLALSTSSLTGFSSSFGVEGAASTYSLTGSALTGDITILAPPHFEISAVGGAYSDSIVLSPAAGLLSANLSVRLSANATLGEHTGSIIHSGGGAVPKYLEISGNVTAPDPTLSLSTSALEPFSTTTNKPSIFQTYTLAGGGLTGNLSVQAPAGFELRQEGAGNFSNSFSLAPVNGSLPQTTIEVRLAASSTAGNFQGQITHSTSGIAPQTISVNGTVIAVEPPVISMSPSGSAYSGKSHSLQIRLQGSTPVSGYGATGLPPGLSINTSTGLISGTPTSNGTFTLAVSATGNGGTASANYTLVIREQNADLSNPLDVLVNKFSNNGTSDFVELLVAAQGVPGGSADLRGMVLKDFSSNMGSDLGGKFIFSNSIVWQSVKAGTLIVLASSNTTEDLVAPDFVLRANLLNPDLFTPAGGGFDIAASDMVLIKAAGTGADGVAGGIHALSVGSAGAQYANFNGRKLNFSRSLNSNRPFVFAVNDSSSLADFYSNSGADISRSLQFGSGNNAKNTTFITSLQTANASNTQPVITLNGTTPMTIAHGTVYSEPGATANDLEDGPLPVAISGSVNAMVVGTYTITYRASDSGNLTTTVDRIVNVTDQTPPVVTLIGNATLELPFGGNFTDPGATANDAVDGNRTVNVSGTVNRFAAGSYILAYTATDSAGNTSPGVTRTVVVAKGVPEISQAPSASAIVFGSALSASTLAGGNASVAGNFSWTDPTTIPPLGTGNFSVTFTPGDSGNYTTANTTAILTVTATPTAFESWAGSKGLEGPNAAASADPDADGFTNAQEFAFGLDPSTPGGKLLEIGQDENARVKITFLQRDGMTCTVRLASDLAAGFNQTLPTSTSANTSNVPEGYTRHEALLPEGEKAFIKIEATTP